METKATWNNLQPGTRVRCLIDRSDRLGKIGSIKSARQQFKDFGYIEVIWDDYNEDTHWCNPSSFIIIEYMGSPSIQCDPFNGRIKI